MPKWGLTGEMVGASPWGLAPESGLLQPAKVVTDPVHGDIYLNRLELLVVNSRPFQRLRRVHQLGMTPQVYPGATNTRFAHSLGSLRVTQDLLDVVFDQRHDPHGVPDLFSEWEQTADESDEFVRRLGEVVIAARLGALLHDIAHVPFGHSIEDDLGLLPAHDKGSERFEFLWQQMAADMKERTAVSEFEALGTLVEGELAAELRPMILSKERGVGGEERHAHSVMRYPFIADLVGNTICADLLDYLPRDHLYSGLPLALGRRFLSAFFVTGNDRTRHASRMALSIVRENRERTDVITELLKYLRYRYELTERVLVHHAKLAADAMVGKPLELWFDELVADIESGDDGDKDVRGPDDTEGGPLGEAPGDDPETRATKRVQKRVLLHGDDGLLEYLRDWADDRRASPVGGSDAARLDALARLVAGLLNRDLFRLAGRSSTQQASAEAIYRGHGAPAERRALEEDAARFAGIDEPWKVCIWLPPPNPRLKSAEVLVFDGSEVVEFYRSEQYKAKRGEDIYEAHSRLWAVSVYIHRSIPHEQARLAVVRLAQRMEVRWDREVEALGAQVLEWPDRLAAREVAHGRGLGQREGELLDLATKQKVARGPNEIKTYDALRAA